MKHRKKQQVGHEREYQEWYSGKPAQPFQPMPFVYAAREQWADRPDLVRALAGCTQQWPESELYTHLHDPSLEHREGRKWRHAGTFPLTCPEFGEMLVDINSHMVDPKHFKIRGIEFLDRAFSRSVVPHAQQQPMQVVHSKYRGK
ncbi:MAG: hypothetical protein ABI599_03635 [Flavobacteriales bacterium]